jgi:exopolysaccharide biosynthesis polyprenyl glycosylphosphotransferase
LNIPNLIGMPDRRGSAKRPFPIDRTKEAGQALVPEKVFIRMLGVERKRAERSRKVFLLMLLALESAAREARDRNALERAGSVVASSIRETDFSGWYKEKSAIGVILTEIGDTDRSSIQTSVSDRIKASLHGQLSKEQIANIKITFHAFPEDWNEKHDGHAANAALYPDIHQGDPTRRLSHLVKRMIDIAGSLAALASLSPVFLAVALAIKLTSKGPIFFKQERVGQHGARFTFLKFRSMHVQNDPSVHREFVTRFIAGKAERAEKSRGTEIIYKITADPRVTPVGNFLRKTSIDELPQFWNVLKGQMSLVGPRPPIPYELAAYDVWHRRRILEVKPGITGLWQVHGRSRTTFDEMVRLDLRYAKTWSLWLDIKIILKTPRAILSCDGAY